MKVFIFSFIALLLISCGSDDDCQKTYPSCLQTEINRIQGSLPQSPRGTIDLYLYQEENVYVVNTNFPDEESKVYSKSCQLICSFGGIGGNQNDSCVDWEMANYIETVWIDNR